MAQRVDDPTKQRWLRIGVAGVALLAAATPALQAQAASTGFRISVTVPQACFLSSTTPLSLTDGGSVSGTVIEACNAGGYQVIAQYRPLAADEGAVLQYAGQSIPLPADGQVVVKVSTMADIAHVAYTLQSTHLDSPLQVSLSVQPT